MTKATHPKSPRTSAPSAIGNPKAIRRIAGERRQLAAKQKTGAPTPDQAPTLPDLLRAITCFSTLLENWKRSEPKYVKACNEWWRLVIGRVPRSLWESGSTPPTKPPLSINEIQVSDKHNLLLARTMPELTSLVPAIVRGHVIENMILKCLPGLMWHMERHEIDSSPLIRLMEELVSIGGPIPKYLDVTEAEVSLQRLALKAKIKSLAPFTVPADDRITMAVALRDYSVSSRTIRREVKAGRLHNYRPAGAPENAPFILSRAELTPRYPRKK
jgi:hypothetical protein